MKFQLIRVRLSRKCKTNSICCYWSTCSDENHYGYTRSNDSATHDCIGLQGGGSSGDISVNFEEPGRYGRITLTSPDHATHQPDYYEDGSYKLTAGA